MKKRSMLELKRLSVEDYKAQEKTPLIIVMDNVRSALNVGSAFRTADAFNIQGIYLCGISAQPPHREILKTALGADKSVDWRYFENTIDAVKALKKEGSRVYAVEQAFESISLEAFTWPEGPIAIVMGNEVEGVAQEVMKLVDACIEIPQFGTKHSLNISVSLGIVLWELFRKYKNWK